MMDSQFSEFTPDITPIMLAAHTNNYEIIKLLVQRKVFVVHVSLYQRSLLPDKTGLFFFLFFIFYFLVKHYLATFCGPPIQLHRVLIVHLLVLLGVVLLVDYSSTGPLWGVTPLS